MKRHPALQDLSREHQHTLSLAQQIIRAIKTEDTHQQLHTLSMKAVDYYHQALNAHFQQEESTLFRIMAETNVQHQALINTYLQEHETLRQHISAFEKKLSPEALLTRMEMFALLLKSHTRKEERELFPLIEESFTEKQFQQKIRENEPQ